MQSETGFPSSHQLKSYVASKSRLKLAARCPVSGCWPSCLCKDGLVGCFLDLPFSFVRQLFMYFGQMNAFHIHFSTVQLCLPLLSPVYNSISFHLWTVWELISVFFTSRMPMGHMLVFRLLGGDFEVFLPTGATHCNDRGEIWRPSTLPSQIYSAADYYWHNYLSCFCLFSLMMLYCADYSCVVCGCLLSGTEV